MSIVKRIRKNIDIYIYIERSLGAGKFDAAVAAAMVMGIPFIMEGGENICVMILDREPMWCACGYIYNVYIGPLLYRHLLPSYRFYDLFGGK